MSTAQAPPSGRLTVFTLLAVVLGVLAAAATLERNHYLATHADTGLGSLVTTSSPAPAEQAIFPSGAPDAVLKSSPAGGVSLGSTPAATGGSAFQNSVVVAQVHALTAIAAVKACAARRGTQADCTKPKAGSLGTSTGLTIVDTAPKNGDVRVIRAGPVYSATAAAARGIWYAVTTNIQTGAESRICLSHHGKQSCPVPTW